MIHGSTPFRLTCLILAVLGIACRPGGETSTPAVSATEVRSADGETLGEISFPTSCDAPTQELLERGMALLHHMTYGQAEATFEAAAEQDPECAIAHWGVAMSYVHPLWPDVPSPEQLARGQELLERSAASGKRSEREDAYIEALGAYYRDGGDRSETERLSGFLDGWAEVHDRFPDDSEAALFHAIALLATAPASDKSYEKQQAAGAITADVRARIPDHPGAHHYTIHAYDFPPLAERALDVAERYRDIAPENSHALHMASHIFTRLGQWPESIDLNRRSADAADERTPDGFLSMHYFHALDYLAYAHLQRADRAAAEEVLEELSGLEPPFQDHAGTAYALAAVPVRHALEWHRWEEAAGAERLEPGALSWDRYPYLEAIPVFARALGAARTGDGASARAEIEQLERLREETAALDMAYDWETQVEIQRLAADAWLAYETGDRDRGLDLMRTAAELEAGTEKNPVTPGEVLPAAELFGDMLLDSGGYDEARRQYETALERSKNRFNSLYGAARAAELAGDTEAAENFYRSLLEVAPEPTGERTELEHARAFLRD